MPYKLLLADNSLTIQKVVELILGPEDFEIKAVSNGNQALQELKPFAPDIILADIAMTELNGYQLCREIKSIPTTKGIPVILLAGAFEPLDEEHARVVGADDFIIKPFESHELISKVKALVVDFGPTKKGDISEISIETDSDIQSTARESGRDKDISLTDNALLQEIRLPSEEEVSAILKDSVDKRVASLDILPYVSSAMRDSLGQTISSSAAEIVENVTRDLVKELLESLRGEINIAIRKIVPEIAETIIRREIERITSEIG